MKKFLLAAFSFLFILSANAQPPAGDAKPGDWYGAKIQKKSPINIAEIPARLEVNPVMDTLVKATVLDVCPKKGCWLKLAVNDSTTAFVKMKDYGFFLPEAVKGKTIILDGKVEVVTTPVEELRHYAEDAKKPQAEIDAITEPKKEIRFLAKGIAVVK